MRLRRVRDLSSVKGYDAGETVLACHSGAGFQAELPGDVRLVGVEELYAPVTS
ncbi:hypothetical protein [Nonomuraea sp. NPDC049709]|uniref:hypothetical protein n=1 Tax=Nonomuraea sp. NPDC049709 TaxID=3154736 RepID=UPI00343C5D10